MIATSPARAALLAGEKVARRLRWPLILDYRDPWSAHEWPTWRRSSISQWFARRLERRIVKRSAARVLNTPAMRASFEKFLASDVVAEFRDPEWLRGRGRGAAAGRPRARFNIVHAGEIFTGRSLVPVLEAAQRLAARHAARPIRVINYGELPAAEWARIRAGNLESFVEVRPRIPFGELFAELQRAHLLLAVIGDHMLYSTPYKVYDYMASGRPILAIAPRGAALFEMLAESGAGLCVEPGNIAGIEQALETFMAGEVAPLRARVERFRWSNLALQYRSVIEKVAESRPAPRHRRAPRRTGQAARPVVRCCRAQTGPAAAQDVRHIARRGRHGATLPHMANDSLPGEQPGKLEALLDRWQVSLDLHARYAALDDARYWHVQPWPKHERPQRWIIQLARKRILALKRIVAQRLGEGDRAFIEGIETMGFLATLVGLTSVERYIPLATRETERGEVLAAKPDEIESRPAPEPARPRAAEARRADAGARTGEHRRTAETTRQMPALPHSKTERVVAAARAGTAPRAAPQAPQVRREPRREAQRPVASQAEEGPVDDHAVRARGHRRCGALVRLGPPMARNRRDDRASRGTAGAVGDPPDPAYLSRPHRRHHDKASRLSIREY